MKVVNRAARPKAATKVANRAARRKAVTFQQERKIIKRVSALQERLNIAEAIIVALVARVDGTADLTRAEMEAVVGACIKMTPQGGHLTVTVER